MINQQVATEPETKATLPVEDDLTKQYIFDLQSTTEAVEETPLQEKKEKSDAE